MAFTLIELMVVMTVIATLSLLTVSGVKVIRSMVNNNTTTDRMEAIKTGISQIGGSDGTSIAMRIQRDGGLNGVLSWKATTTGSLDGAQFAQPDTNQWSGSNNYWTKRGLQDPGAPNRTFTWLNQGGITANYALTTTNSEARDLGQSPYMPFPWGKPRPAAIVNPSLAQTNPILPDPFLLRWCSPYRTRELLEIAGIISKGTTTNPAYPDYMTDRSSKRVWNDAWGNPLVVAFAMYQAPKNSSDFNHNTATNSSANEDYILIHARKSYQTDREIYISIAAAGPTLPSELSNLQVQIDPNVWNDSAKTNDAWTTPTANGILRNIWKLAAISSFQEIANTTPPSATLYGATQYFQLNGSITSLEIWPGEWSEKSWESQPWQGIRRKEFKHRDSGLNHRCFLSSPLAFR